ncbi:MAG: hypothetical protein GY765_29110 [bacterium]|nr:hypothetical protein [bacterium]
MAHMPDTTKKLAENTTTLAAPAPADTPPDDTPPDESPKPKAKNRSIKERLMRIFVALSSCLKPPMLAKLAARGYPAETLNAIMVIYDDVMAKCEVKDAAYKKQYKTTQFIVTLIDTAKDRYAKLRKLAQVALKADTGSLRALDLTGRTKSRLSGFISQAKLFYVNVASDDELAAQLAVTGITREEVAAELVKLVELEQLNIQQEYEKKQAQEATEARDASMVELDAAFADLYKVGQVALADDKQYLELLAIN